jgi:putative membrane protein
MASVDSAATETIGGSLPFGPQLSAAASGAAFGVLASFVGLTMMARRRSPDPEHFAVLSTAVVDKGADPKDEGSSDARTEQHRIDQRIVYNMGLWRKHRAASRYTRAILTVPQSYVVTHVANPVLVLSLITAGICALEQYWGNPLSLPTSLFSLSAPSLALLLVFRTNASYERWDGARKMIGLVKNRSEDLIRQVSTRFPDNRSDLKEQFLRYLQAFFFSLKVHLRSGPGGFEDDSNLIQDLTPILKPQELDLALKATNRPAHMMHSMTLVAKSAGLDGAALLCLDQNLTVLADVLGGCERIRGTPIPLSYTRMTTRFLIVWLLLLPLAMSGEVMKLTGNIWLTIPAEAFIAFALLGVEEVAVQIEEPFTILPMEAYAENSRKNTGSIFAQMNEVAQVGRTIN